MLNQVASYLHKYSNEETQLSIVCHGYSAGGVKKLLKKDVAIRYLVTSQSKELLSLVNVYPKFEIRLFNGPDVRMETFHFVIGINPVMMWIEREHPLGFMVAQDCNWVPPSEARYDHRISVLRKSFEEAWKTATLTVS